MGTERERNILLEGKIFNGFTFIFIRFFEVGSITELGGGSDTFPDEHVHPTNFIYILSLSLPFQEFSFSSPPLKFHLVDMADSYKFDNHLQMELLLSFIPCSLCVYWLIYGQGDCPLVVSTR